MKIKILVIDDNIILCKLVSETLTLNGYFVTTETKGAKSLNVAKIIKPDLVLLDTILKDVDGYKVCKEFKNDAELKDIPILFLTSKNDKKAIAKGFEVGATDYIIKPFNSVELLARVKCHAENKILSDKLKYNLKMLEESLHLNKELAVKDPLTNLYNRRYIMESLNKRFNCHNSIDNDYLLLIDIDDFKRVNDTYGHNMGDEVIKNISKIIQCSSGENSIVGRWGGEEIVVVLENSFDFIKIAELIRTSICNHYFTCVDNTFNNTITIGCTKIDYSKTIEENISLADECLYKGKKNGKNQVVINDVSLNCTQILDKKQNYLKI